MAAKLQKVIFIMQTLVDKLQFIGLIGGAGFQPAAAAGLGHATYSRLAREHT